MGFNLILFKLMALAGLSCSMAAVINKDTENADVNISDLQASATSAKLLGLGSLFGYGGNSGGYYPSNTYRPGCNPCYSYNTAGGFYPSVGKYPTTNFAAYNPNNNNYYPTTGTGTGVGTNILGGGYGYGGYGGYGGNGGLRQYYGYYDPSYIGQRNLGYAYYTNTNNYGLPRETSDRVSYSYRGYE